MPLYLYRRTEPAANGLPTTSINNSNDKPVKRASYTAYRKDIASRVSADGEGGWTCTP